MHVTFDHYARGAVNIRDQDGGVVGSMVWDGTAWEIWSHVEPEDPIQLVGRTCYNQQFARGIAHGHFAKRTTASGTE